METSRKNPYATNAAGVIGPLYKDKQPASTVICAKSDLRAGKQKTVKAK